MALHSRLGRIQNATFVKTITVVVALSSLCFIGCSPTNSDSTGTNASATNLADKPDSAERETQPEQPAPIELDRETVLGRATSDLSRGKFDRAISSLRALVLQAPDDVEALFLLARASAGQGDFKQAIAVMDEIPIEHPQAGLPALGQSADWCLQAEMYEQAESRYRKILKRVPGAAIAHRQLAKLLNRQGRRHEAAPHLRRLCELGDIREDELRGLIIVSHAMFTDPENPNRAGVENPYFPIGKAAYARYKFTQSEFRAAADMLRDAAEREVPSIDAFYGRLLVESQQDDQFVGWLESVSDPVRQQSEYWSALGAYYLRGRQFESAVGALGRALESDSTDPLSVRRMNQALLALDQSEIAEHYKQRYGALNDATHAANFIASGGAASPEAYRDLVTSLLKLDRKLEANTWSLFAALARKATKPEVDAVMADRKTILASGESFPDGKTRFGGLDLASYPAPKSSDFASSASSSKSTPVAPASQRIDPRFETRLLSHRYSVSDRPQPYAFAIYQTLGGGVAVTDLDLDGWPDLYLAQGACDPAVGDSTQTNVLLRQIDGQLTDVTLPSDTSEFRYSVGVTSGDWNQDGFPDLVVTSIGGKLLLVNRGDGTFDRRPFDDDPTKAILPSSVAIADVTGNHLPDIVMLHDVDDPAMLNKPMVRPDGSFDDVASPVAFRPGLDLLAVNDASGGIKMRSIGDEDNSRSTGLGTVVADLDGQPGNEIFVGNDVRPNQLWKRSPDKSNWTDVASIYGCSHSDGGLSTASMGIAAGDFDGSGSLDLHVTNFLNEPACLFLNEGGRFIDWSVSRRLSDASIPVLGFGTQAVDFDNNGTSDLMVSNGHVDKLPGQAFAMPPQLFVNQGQIFELQDVADASGYWQQSHLGRAMARLDFDRDGRSDVVISHLDSPTALLINQSETPNRSLRVRLAGVQSERDAIGAQIRVTCGQNTWTHWSISGDGYLAANEDVIPIGVGTNAVVDSLEVIWPSGNKDVYRNLKTGQEVLLIEGQQAPWTSGSVK